MVVIYYLWYFTPTLGLMIRLEWAKSAYIQKKISIIEDLKKEILKVSTNNFLESRLEREAIFNSTYYSILLAGIEVYISDAEEIIFENKVGNIPYEKANVYLNYSKVVSYIHEYYSKTNAEINHQFICNLNKTILQGLSHSDQSGSYRLGDILLASKYIPCSSKDIQSRMDDLTSFLEKEDDIHPIVKAGLFYIEFMKIRPFFDGNGRTARAILLFYLYKAGYSFSGFYSLEKYMCKNRNRRYKYSLAKSLGKSYESNNCDSSFLKFYVYASSLAVSEIFQKLRNPEKINDINLSERQLKLLDYLKENKRISMSEYVLNISNNPSHAARDIERLRDMGFLEKKGFGRSTYYILRKSL